MPNSYENLTTPTTFNYYMSQAKTLEEKRAFLLKALTQYERDNIHYDADMRPCQVVVHLDSQDNPDYLLDWHTIRIPYQEGASCTEYLCNMEHEHEHAQQRMGRGYSEVEKKLCDASFAVYPTQHVTQNGLLTLEYAYNYTELRALQAEAEWILGRAQGRPFDTPGKVPDYFTPEKKEVLDALRMVKRRIDGRPNVSHALLVNKNNQRMTLRGKYNPKYANGMGRWQMSRTFKHSKKLIKRTMKDLKALSQELEKAIKTLEYELAPEREEEVFRKEQEKRVAYEKQLEQQLPELAKACGFDILDKFPTDQSYACIQCNSLHLLQFYLRGFNKDLQYNPAAAGQMHLKETTGGAYLIMVPKALADQLQSKEREPRMVQSTLSPTGITYDDEISAAAMMGERAAPLDDAR